MSELRVDLYGRRIGAITGDNASFDFQFAPAAIEEFGAGSAVLSVAMLAAHPFTRTHRARRQTFFTELLPEGRNREWLCAQAGLPYGDVWGLLSRYGRDIAGALSVWDPTAVGEPRHPGIQPVTDAEISATLADMSAMPLGNERHRGASSVAGVQAKMVLARVEDTWLTPLDGYPSTHILKPVDREGPPTLIWDEEYGMRLARGLGLASHATAVQHFDGRAALVVERFDRDPAVPGGRIHQEDMSQALGASGDQKYQRSGGKVSLGRVADVVRAHCGSGDLTRLARRLVLSVVVGDLDMHTKNVSLLHPLGGDVHLAPAYDVVPQAHHAPAGEMALAVAGEYRHSRLTRGHLIDEVSSWKVRRADALVDEALEELSALVEREEPLDRAWPRLHEHVCGFASALREGRACGQIGAQADE